MASAKVKKDKGEPEVVSVELPAPEGWIKKFTPKQEGTPRRNEVVFISPTGEDIKNRRQLDQYLRSHPGGPPSSSFDWGTGDTPRRSARISEKVKISPEAEKSTRADSSNEKRASRSRERAKTSVEVEKTKLASSSGLQKGTKRKKKIENDGDEAEEETFTAEDGPKNGNMVDGEGSKEGKKRKTTNVDEHKAEGNGYSAERDSPKDVDMDQIDGTKHTESKVAATIEETHGVDHELTERTKENVEDSAEPTVENVYEIVEQDVKLPAESGTELEPNKTLKETPIDTQVSPTAASDSEKVAFIEKKDRLKDVVMQEAGLEAAEGGIHGLIVHDSTNKNNKDIQENKESQGEINYEVADRGRKSDGIEEPEGTEHKPTCEGVYGLGDQVTDTEHVKAKADADIEEVYGSVERESTDETQASILEPVEQPAESKSAIRLESAVIVEEIVQESVELCVEIQGEIKQAFSDKAKENDDFDVAENGGPSESKEGGTGKVKTDVIIKNVKESVEKLVESQIDIKHEFSVKENEDDEKVVQALEQDVVDSSVGTEDAETLSGSGGKKDEVAASGKDEFQQWKEIGEDPIDAGAFQPAPGSEGVFVEEYVDVSDAKIEPSALINETVTLSENGGKAEEVIDSLDDFLHDYDDENMHIQPSPSNW